jgi:hypothetical protein
MIIQRSLSTNYWSSSDTQYLDGYGYDRDSSRVLTNAIKVFVGIICFTQAAYFPLQQAARSTRALHPSNSFSRLCNRTKSSTRK